MTLVPRTHTADRSPNFGEPHETIAAVMKRGSVLVWNGSLWHGGGANQATARRIGLVYRQLRRRGVASTRASGISR